MAGLAVGSYHFGSRLHCRDGQRVTLHVHDALDTASRDTDDNYRAMLHAQHAADVAAEQKSLREEQRRHGDLLFLPVVDVYRFVGLISISVDI